ncbi:hypothetical protein [Steroidobacter gossypii]|nr:hypothetical protein [Steroidobacter gossypii]
MVLSSPKMVAATDVLTIAARDTNLMCFHLLTFARERHRCEIQGIARKEKDGAYVFRENLVVLRFEFVAEDQVSVEPLGNGYRARCEPSGKIERAIYTSSGER